MRTDNTNIKKCAEDFVPEAPESYERMITDTVSALKAKDRAEPKRVRRVWKPLAAAAAVLAALVIAAGAVFGSRPALAADIPGLSGLVYAASPKRTANAADRERIGSLVGEGFRALAAGEYTVYEAGYEGPVLHSGENLATTGNGTITLTGSASVNSIWMMGASSSDQTLAASEGVTLTVASGAIQVNSYGAAVYAVPTDLNTSRGYFSGRSGVDWTLSGAISGSGGLTFADSSLAQSSKGVKLNTEADFTGDCYVFGYCWFNCPVL